MSKVLLVDDNEMNRDMLTRRLERKDFEVVIAVDGQAGIDMTSRTANPQIVDLEVRFGGGSDFGFHNPSRFFGLPSARSEWPTTGFGIGSV